MRFLALMGLGLCVFVTGLTLPATDANAVVCARGPYGGGCAVGVHRGYYHRGAVVHRGYYHRGVVVRGRRW